MSIETARWALRQRVDDPETKLVLLALAIQSEQGLCLATWREDVNYTGIDPDDYMRHLLALAQGGLVQTDINPSREGFRVVFPVF